MMRNRRITSPLSLAALSVMFCFPSAATFAAAPQSSDTLHQISSSFEALASRVSPAVVEILVSGYGPDEEDSKDPNPPISRESSQGSGVIVDPNGYIITNYHVIKGEQRVNVVIPPTVGTESQAPAVLRLHSRILPATVVGFSRAADLAVLKVNATGLPTIPFALYTRLRQGQLVLAFGSPEGLQNSVTLGLVSSVLRQVDPESPMVFIQTDAAINPGNSGGALVDVDGNLVGINASIYTQSGGNEGIGFAIPSGIVRFVYNQIRQYGYVRKGDIGADVQSLTPGLVSALGLPSDNGVIVSDVIAGSPAEQAGLRVYDLIQTMDGIPIDSVPTFKMGIYLRDKGDRVRLGVLRGTKQLTLVVPVVEGKEAPESIADFADPAKGMVHQLGIIGVDLTPEVSNFLPPSRIDSGVVVAATTADHRADEIGLRAGDIIHALNTDPVTNLASLRAAVSHLKPGGAGALQIEHNGQLMFLTFEVE